MKRKKTICILKIHSTDRSKISVSLYVDDRWYEKSLPSSHTAQMVLPLIEDILRQQGRTVFHISEISVDSAISGSFTGMRVGASVGNILAAILGIPINGKRTPFFPSYDDMKIRF